MAGGTRIRILILDDDETLNRRLRGWLEADGYDVATFADAHEALRYAARVAHELALVDLRLAGRDGSQVIRELTRASPRTVALAMTAFPEVAQVIAAFRAGARDLLEKPLAQATLLRAVGEHLTNVGLLTRDEGEFNQRLGRRLRAVRQEAARTIASVAAPAGITAAQLSQIERGRNGTTAWTLARICAALRVPLARLFEDL